MRTYGILGPLEIHDGKEAVGLGGGRQRALLALLLLRVNEVVSSDRLVEELWGDAPPPTAGKALQGLVSQLRRVLGPEVLLTRAPGYVLTVEPEAVDAHRFELLAAAGRGALDEGDPRTAAGRLREALSLWRGPPLAEFAFDEFAQDAIRRLEEARLAATEDRIEAELALGRHRRLVEELEALVGEHPLRERPRGQLMVALYRSGRQADALEAYRAGREALVTELGIEPGPELQRLHRAILAQDAALDPPPTAAPVLRRAASSRRRLLALAAIAGAGVAIGAALTFRDAAPEVVADSLVRIDPRTDEIVDVVPVGRWPDQATAAGRFVFVVNDEDDTVSRLDTRSGEVVDLGNVRSPFGLATQDERTVWIGSYSTNEVVRVNAATLAVERRVRLPGDAAGLLAVGGGSLWATQNVILGNDPNPVGVSRLALSSSTLAKTYGVGRNPVSIAFGGGAAWVLNKGDSTVTRVHAHDESRTTFDVGHLAVDVTHAYGSVWVASEGEGTVWRLNPVTGRPQAIIPVGRWMWDVAAGAGSIWVTCAEGPCRDGSVTRIDPRTNSVVARIRTGFGPHGIAAAPDGVWVGVAREWFSFPYPP